jgi:hypothetical protein
MIAAHDSEALIPKNKEQLVKMNLKKISWSGFLLLALIPIAVSPSPVQQQVQKKPNILFIMGDDIGWMQVGVYHRGIGIGETPNIDRPRARGRDVHNILRDAELHLRAQRVYHRH